MERKKELFVFLNILKIIPQKTKKCGMENCGQHKEGYVAV